MIATGVPLWIHLHLPSCRPGFESQAHYLHFNQFIKLCNVEKMKVNKKKPGLAHFFKKRIAVPLFMSRSNDQDEENDIYMNFLPNVISRRIERRSISQPTRKAL